jgi:hypothetical protein
MASASNATAGARSVAIGAHRPRPKATLAEEAALLEQARAALARDPSRSLALVREFDKRFAHPQLRAERNLIEMRTLSALGRNGDARGIEPHSIYRHRVRQEDSKENP